MASHGPGPRRVEKAPAQRSQTLARQLTQRRLVRTRADRSPRFDGPGPRRRRPSARENGGPEVEADRGVSREASGAEEPRPLPRSIARSAKRLPPLARDRSCRVWSPSRSRLLPAAGRELAERAGPQTSRAIVEARSAARAPAPRRARPGRIRPPDRQMTDGCRWRRAGHLPRSSARRSDTCPSESVP